MDTKNSFLKSHSLTDVQVSSIYVYDLLGVVSNLSHIYPVAELDYFNNIMTNFYSQNKPGVNSDDALIQELITSIRELKNKANITVEALTGYSITSEAEIVNLRELLQRYYRLQALPKDEKYPVNYDGIIRNIALRIDAAEGRSLTYLAQASAFRDIQHQAAEVLVLLEKTDAQTKMFGEYREILQKLKNSVDDNTKELIDYSKSVLRGAGEDTENIGVLSSSNILASLGQLAVEARNRRQDDYLLNMESNRQEIANYTSAALQYENHTPALTKKDANSVNQRLQENINFLPKHYTTVKLDYLGGGQQYGQQALDTGISQYYIDSNTGRHFIIVPFRAPRAKTGELVRFEIDSQADFKHFINSPAAFLAIESGRATVYPERSSLLINLPERGLVLIHPDAGYKSVIDEIRADYFSGDRSVKRFMYNKRSYLLGAQVEMVNMLLPFPEDYVLQETLVSQGYTHYRLLDAMTGEPLFAGRDADLNLVIQATIDGKQKYLTAAAYNLSVHRSLSGSVMVLTEEGDFQQVRYLHRTVYGVEIWQQESGEGAGTFYQRSPDKTRFIRETALNQSKKGWTSTSLFSATDSWIAVKVAVKEAVQTDITVKWTAQDGTVYSNRIFADSTRYPHILSYIASTDELVALSYHDSKWFRVDIPSGSLRVDQQFTFDENTLAFVPSSEPDKIYSKVNYNQQSVWRDVALSLLNAADQDQFVEWTRSGGPVFTSRKWLSNLSVNQHRLVNLSGKSGAELIDTIQQNQGWNSTDVAPVSLINGTWVEIDHTTGQLVVGSSIVYDELGEYFYRLRSPRGVQRFMTSTADWAEIDNRVVDGKHDAEWVSPEGIVYSSVQYAADKKHRLVVINDNGIQRVIAVEYAGQQLWNVINTDTGEIIPGVFAKNSDAGIFDLFYDQEVAEAVEHLTETTKTRPQRDIMTPVSDSQSTLRYRETESWHSVAQAVKEQKNSGRNVEWLAPDGNVYQSKTAGDYLLAVTDDSGDVSALQRIIETVWVAIDPRTGEANYHQVFSRSPDGQLTLVADLVSDLTERLEQVAPELLDRAEGGIPSDSQFVAKVATERAIFNASSSKAARFFEFDGQSYVIAVLEGGRDGEIPALTGAVLMRRRSAAGSHSYDVLDGSTYAVVATDGRPVQVIERDKAFARPQYWNQDISAAEKIAEIVTANGQVVKACFLLLDVSGDEVWVATTPDGTKPTISKQRLTFFRRSLDGGRFVEYHQGLPGGMNGEDGVAGLMHILVDPASEETNISQDWEVVRRSLSSDQPLAFRPAGGKHEFSVDNSPGNRDRILSILNEAGEHQFVPATRILGSLWMEVNPVTGMPNGSLLQLNSTGDLIRIQAPLSEWLRAKTVGSPVVAGELDLTRLERSGVSPDLLSSIRNYVPGMDFSPIASKPGHHDYLQGILLIRNDISSGFSTKVMVPVVTYGKKEGFTSDTSFVRGFGGRLIPLDRFIYAYQNLTGSIDPNDPNSKTFHDALTTLYGDKDLPVRNILILLSEVAEYYERAPTGGNLPTILKVDAQAPSIDNIARAQPRWGSYANGDFTVPGLQEIRPGVVHNNQRSVFLSYNKLENQFIIFHGAWAKNTGTSPQGEAAGFISGPIISRLSGVRSVAVLSNHNLPGKHSFLDFVRRQFNAMSNVQLEIPENAPVTLVVTLQDGSLHLVKIHSGAVNMLNLSSKSKDVSKIFGGGANGEQFSNINTYSYDGAIAGSSYTPSGLPEPKLVLDNGDTVPVAPLVIPPPEEGDGFKQALSYLSDKVLLQILMGVGDSEIVGPNMLSKAISTALNVVRKIGTIGLSQQIVPSILEAIFGDGPAIGAYGKISPEEGHFWGGITAMVVTQEMLTFVFGKLRESMPPILASRDTFVSHYALPTAANAFTELMRLYANYSLQVVAGFPRGGPASEMGVPVLAASLHSILETMRSHGANVDAPDFRDGFLQVLQFAVDSVARGSQNALATEGIPFSDIALRAIAGRFFGRLPDKALSPLAREAIEWFQTYYGDVGSPMLDQYRRIYGKENPAGAWLSEKKLGIGNSQHWLANRIRSTSNTFKDLPMLRIASRMNRAFLLGPLSSLINRLTGVQNSSGEFGKTTVASLTLDEFLAGRSGVDYAAIFNEMKNGSGRGADFAKPSMSWLRNTPPEFQQWISKQPWRPDLFMSQADPQFIQRLALAFTGEIQSGRLPQELGTFSSVFQSQIAKINNALLSNSTLKKDLENRLNSGEIDTKTYNAIQRAIFEYTVESGFYHYLLRYSETGVPKFISIVDGIDFHYRTMSKANNTTGDKDLQVTPLDVLLVNFGGRLAQKYNGITYRGVNTQVGYAPDHRNNVDAGENMGHYLQVGDFVTNTEMFSTSQSGWMATSFGAGIDQLQLRTDTRQKLVILGESSFNATQLADLNQAEAIFTPGTIFEIDKIEGYAEGNDIGNVVYMRQVNTFDWERNYYYWKTNDFDKIIQTNREIPARAMDPVTGIVYQLIKNVENGVTTIRSFYKPINNYFMGWGLDQREGEFATWFRPFDSVGTPQAMRDDIYSLWLNNHDFVNHLNESVENIHHNYFRNKFRNVNPREASRIEDFRQQRLTEMFSGADTAIKLLKDPSMGESSTTLTTIQRSKLLVWQMANLLRRQVNMYRLTQDGRNRLTVKGSSTFSVTEAFDGVRLSSSLDSLAQSAISVGFRIIENKLRIYVLLPSNQSTTGQQRNDNWVEVDFEAHRFSSSELENLAQAISIAANSQGYSGKTTDVLSEMDYVALSRYEALIGKMRALSDFNYDRYRLSLAKAYAAIARDESLDRVPESKTMQEEQLPPEFRGREIKKPQGYELSPQTFGHGADSVVLENIVKDSNGRMWFQRSDGDTIHLIPVTLYPSFDYDQGSPNILVFQNQDINADKTHRFILWDREKNNTEMRSYLPPNTHSLKNVSHAAIQNLWVDSNQNIFLKLGEGEGEYIAVKEVTGFRWLRGGASADLVFEDLTDPSGRFHYLWREQPWTGSRLGKNWVRMELISKSYDKQVSGDIALIHFLDRQNDTTWIHRSFRADGSSARWMETEISTENGLTVFGSKVVYTERGADDTEKLALASLTELDAAAKAALEPSGRFSPRRMLGTLSIQGMDFLLERNINSNKLYLSVRINGEFWAVVSIGSTGKVTIESPDGATHDIETTELSERINNQSSAGMLDGASLPAGGLLVIDAILNGKQPRKALFEIQKGEFIFARVFSQSGDLWLITEERSGKLLKFNRSNGAWIAHAAPEKVNNIYSLTAWSVDGGKTVIYWDPATSGWRALSSFMLTVGGENRRSVQVGKQVLLLNTDSTTGQVDFSWNSKTATHITSLGGVMDSAGQPIWLSSDVEYQAISAINGFQRTTMPAEMPSFIREFYSLLLPTSVPDATIEIVINSLKAKGIESIKDLMNAEGIKDFLETLASLHAPSKDILRKIAIQMHLPDGVEFSYSDQAGKPEAVLHVAIDATGQTFERWHWGSEQNFAKREGSRYSQPVNRNELPQPTVSTSGAVPYFDRSFLRFTITSPSVLENGKWKLSMSEHSRVLADLASDASGNHISDTYIVENDSSVTLYVRDGDKYLEIGARKGTNTFLSIDLGQKVAYFDVGIGKWRFVNVETTPHGRTIKVSGYELLLTEASFGQPLNPQLNGLPVNSMTQGGDLTTADNFVHQNVDSTLGELLQLQGFYLGSARGTGNNCLINSLLQIMFSQGGEHSTPDEIQKKADRVRELMIAEMESMKAKDPTVNVIGANEQIDVTNIHELTALVSVLRQSTALGRFGAKDTLVIHGKFGLEYRATSDDIIPERAFHLWYETTTDAGDSGHFSPILNRDPKIPSYTLMDPTTHRFTRVSDTRGALGNGAVGSNLPTQSWDAPSLTELSERARLNPTSSFNYERQLILQLNGDIASYKASSDLFGKHPKQTEWMQVRDRNAKNAFAWREDDNAVSSVLPLQFDEKGRVKIVLVGHSTVDVNGNRLFAGMNAGQLIQLLEQTFANGQAWQFSGIHIDLVGCGLYQPGSGLDNNIPGRIAEWLMSKGDALHLSRDSLSVSARQYPVRLAADGKKEILLDNGSWVTKEVARLSDIVHKQVFVWDKATKTIVLQPHTTEELTYISQQIDEEKGKTGLSTDETTNLTQMETIIENIIVDRLHIGIGLQTGEVSDMASLLTVMEELTGFTADNFQAYKEKYPQASVMQLLEIATMDRLRDRVQGIEGTNEALDAANWTADESLSYLSKEGVYVPGLRMAPINVERVKEIIAVGDHGDYMRLVVALTKVDPELMKGTAKKLSEEGDSVEVRNLGKALQKQMLGERAIAGANHIFNVFNTLVAVRNVINDWDHMSAVDRGLNLAQIVGGIGVPTVIDKAITVFFQFAKAPLSAVGQAVKGGVLDLIMAPITFAQIGMSWENFWKNSADTHSFEYKSLVANTVITTVTVAASLVMTGVSLAAAISTTIAAGILGSVAAAAGPIGLAIAVAGFIVNGVVQGALQIEEYGDYFTGVGDKVEQFFAAWIGIETEDLKQAKARKIGKEAADSTLKSLTESWADTKIYLSELFAKQGFKNVNVKNRTYQVEYGIVAYDADGNGTIDSGEYGHLLQQTTTYGDMEKIVSQQATGDGSVWVDVGTNNASIAGVLDKKNMFNLQGDAVVGDLVGGNKEDVFNIGAWRPISKIDGGNGKDTLVLDASNGYVELDLTTGILNRSAVRDDRASLLSSQISNIENLVLNNIHSGSIRAGDEDNFIDVSAAPVNGVRDFIEVYAGGGRNVVVVNDAIYAHSTANDNFLWTKGATGTIDLKSTEQMQVAFIELPYAYRSYKVLVNGPSLTLMGPDGKFLTIKGVFDNNGVPLRNKNIQLKDKNSHTFSLNLHNAFDKNGKALYPVTLDKLSKSYAFSKKSDTDSTEITVLPGDYAITNYHFSKGAGEFLVTPMTSAISTLAFSGLINEIIYRYEGKDLVLENITGEGLLKVILHNYQRNKAQLIVFAQSSDKTNDLKMVKLPDFGAGKLTVDNFADEHNLIDPVIKSLNSTHYSRAGEIVYLSDVSDSIAFRFIITEANAKNVNVNIDLLPNLEYIRVGYDLLMFDRSKLDATHGLQSVRSVTIENYFNASIDMIKVNDLLLSRAQVLEKVQNHIGTAVGDDLKGSETSHMSGLNGSDIYEVDLSRATKTVIENFATDNVMDILSLKGINDISALNLTYTRDDLIVSHGSASIKIVKYNISPESRHLRIQVEGGGRNYILPAFVDNKIYYALPVGLEEGNFIISNKPTSTHIVETPSHGMNAIFVRLPDSLSNMTKQVVGNDLLLTTHSGQKVYLRGYYKAPHATRLGSPTDNDGTNQVVIPDGEPYASLRAAGVEAEFIVRFANAGISAGDAELIENHRLGRLPTEVERNKFNEQVIPKDRSFSWLGTYTGPLNENQYLINIYGGFKFAITSDGSIKAKASLEEEWDTLRTAVNAFSLGDKLLFIYNPLSGDYKIWNLTRRKIADQGRLTNNYITSFNSATSGSNPATAPSGVILYLSDDINVNSDEWFKNYQNNIIGFMGAELSKKRILIEGLDLPPKLIDQLVDSYLLVSASQIKDTIAYLRIGLHDASVINKFVRILGDDSPNAAKYKIQPEKLDLHFVNTLLSDGVDADFVLDALNSGLDLLTVQLYRSKGVASAYFSQVDAFIKSNIPISDKDLLKIALKIIGFRDDLVGLLAHIMANKQLGDYRLVNEFIKLGIVNPDTIDRYIAAGLSPDEFQAANFQHLQYRNGNRNDFIDVVVRDSGGDLFSASGSNVTYYADKDGVDIDGKLKKGILINTPAAAAQARLPSGHISGTYGDDIGGISYFGRSQPGNIVDGSVVDGQATAWGGYAHWVELENSAIKIITDVDGRKTLDLTTAFSVSEFEMGSGYIYPLGTKFKVVAKMSLTDTDTVVSDELTFSDKMIVPVNTRGKRYRYYQIMPMNNGYKLDTSPAEVNLSINILTPKTIKVVKEVNFAGKTIGIFLKHKIALSAMEFIIQSAESGRLRFRVSMSSSERTDLPSVVTDIKTLAFTTGENTLRIQIDTFGLPYDRYEIIGVDGQLPIGPWLKEINFDTLPIGHMSDDRSSKYAFWTELAASKKGQMKSGTTDNDTIVGTPENSLIVATPGKDVLDGKSGDDLVDYKGQKNAIKVDLSSSSPSSFERINDQWVEKDILRDIEGVIGTNGNDELIGNHKDNYFQGGAGVDVIHGERGNDFIAGGDGLDVLQGGEGFDVLDYSGENKALTVDLSVNRASYNDVPNGTSIVDNIDGFEAVVGSNFDDTLIGVKTGSYFRGGKGNDLIQAAQGDDMFVVALGDGDDRIHDSGGQDKLVLDCSAEVAGIEDVWLSRADNNLTVKFRNQTGTKNASAMIEGYFNADQSNSIEEIHLNDRILFKTDIDQLVSAMAGKQDFDYAAMAPSGTVGSLAYSAWLTLPYKRN